MKKFISRYKKLNKKASRLRGKEGEILALVELDLLLAGASDRDIFALADYVTASWREPEKARGFALDLRAGAIRRLEQVGSTYSEHPFTGGSTPLFTELITSR